MGFILPFKVTFLEEPSDNPALEVLVDVAVIGTVDMKCKGGTYGSSGPGRGKSWTNVTFRSKVRGCYGQRKAKIHTLSSPTI